jgi:hypothetical protein
LVVGGGGFVVNEDVDGDYIDVDLGDVELDVDLGVVVQLVVVVRIGDVGVDGRRRRRCVGAPVETRMYAGMGMPVMIT